MPKRNKCPLYLVMVNCVRNRDQTCKHVRAGVWSKWTHLYSRRRDSNLEAAQHYRKHDIIRRTGADFQLCDRPLLPEYNFVTNRDFPLRSECESRGKVRWMTQSRSGISSMVVTWYWQFRIFVPPLQHSTTFLGNSARFRLWFQWSIGVIQRSSVTSESHHIVHFTWSLLSSVITTYITGKKKQSRYTPWRSLGGEEI
jgi:hypothetical protein